MICFDTQPQIWRDTVSLYPVVSINAGGGAQLLTYNFTGENNVMQNGVLLVKHENSAVFLSAEKSFLLFINSFLKSTTALPAAGEHNILTSPHLA